MNVKLINVAGPKALPNGSAIVSLTYEGTLPNATAGTDPILITVSVNSLQTDPAQAVEALREAADQLDDSIDQFNEFTAQGGDVNDAEAAQQFAGDFI